MSLINQPQNRQTIRVETTRELAEAVVRVMRESGYVVSDEAIPYIEEQVSQELDRLDAAQKVSGMVSRRIMPTFDCMQDYIGRVVSTGMTRFVSG